VARQVLVLTPVALDAGLLEGPLRAHAGQDARLRVVVPAVGVSKLQWLANEEDEARAAAAVTAEVVESSTGDLVHAETGDSDPVQAVEDALRVSPADEIVIVTRPDEDADWLEGGSVAESLGRFDLPVHHLVVREATGEVEPGLASVRPIAEPHEVARGADEATPARLLNRVGATVLGAAAIVIVLVLVVYWLA
jgi:hypothetical protein